MPGTGCAGLMRDAAKAIHTLGCFNADDIKVRIRPVEFSFLGIHEQPHSFVAAEIQVMNNKSPEQLEQLIESVHQVLLNHFQETIGASSLTTKISFLEPALYRRWFSSAKEITNDER